MDTIISLPVVRPMSYSQYVVECEVKFFWLNTIQFILFAIYMGYTAWIHRSRLGIGNILLCVGSLAIFMGREITFLSFQTTKFCEKSIFVGVTNKYTLNFMVEISGGHVYLRFFN